MNKLLNILDKNNLIERIKFNSLFILNFECLKDFIINEVKDFFTFKYKNVNGELIGIPDVKYNKFIRTLDKDPDIASLKWLESVNAINDIDITVYNNLKDKRNEITHEFYKTLFFAIDENDKSLFNKLTNMYSKIDKWFINTIEIPTKPEVANLEYDENGVMGGQALVLQLITNSVLNNDYSMLDDLYDNLRP